MDTVFISYAREDKSTAERIYMDLRKNEISAWIDSKCLLPGENWEKTIRKTIKQARFFLLLISKYSINKRGFVQKEIKEAIKIKEEFPSDQIFLIPVRLDDTIPVDEELQNLNWVDLNRSYQQGLSRILTVFSILEKEPIKYISPITSTEVRAPIHYNPFENFEDFIKQFIDKLPTSTMYANPDFSYYLTIRTEDELRVKIPDYLRNQYPNTITIVLQYQYKDLYVYPDNSFTVSLYFKGKLETIGIHFSEIVKIESPELNLRIERLNY